MYSHPYTLSLSLSLKVDLVLGLERVHNDLFSFLSFLPCIRKLSCIKNRKQSSIKFKEEILTENTSRSFWREEMETFKSNVKMLGLFQENLSSKYILSLVSEKQDNKGK